MLQTIINLLRPNPKSKRVLWLSAGHGTNPKRDRGASYVSTKDEKGEQVITEGEMTEELRQKILHILTDWGFASQVRVDKSENITVDTFKSWSKLVSPGDLALDLHFNSGPITARGTEAVVPDNPTLIECTLAKLLASQVSFILGTSKRGQINFNNGSYSGVKFESQSQHSKLLWMKLKCETVLLETCFPSNAAEQKVYFQKIDDIASEIANILASWLREDI